MNTPLVAAVLASVTAVAVFAATFPPGYDEHPSVVDAVAKAKATGKPVVVYYAEQQCAACDAHDGWLLRADIRQAYKDAYHFVVVYGDDMVADERARWKATYVPRGAPSWVVLDAGGGYVCTASGGFGNATAALDLHKLLGRVLSSRNASAELPKIGGAAASRPCTERGLGLAPGAA